MQAPAASPSSNGAPAFTFGASAPATGNGGGAPQSGFTFGQNMSANNPFSAPATGANPFGSSNGSSSFSGPMGNNSSMDVGRQMQQQSQPPPQPNAFGGPSPGGAPSFAFGAPSSNQFGMNAPPPSFGGPGFGGGQSVSQPAGGAFSMGSAPKTVTRRIKKARKPSHRRH